MLIMKIVIVTITINNKTQEMLMNTIRKKKSYHKNIAVLLVIVLTLVLSACGNQNNSTAPENTTNENDTRLSVVTSIYPIYFLTKEIGGEHVKVTNLIATGVEPHDWTPKSKDLIVASKANLLLYHGVGLETWIDDFKKGLATDSQVTIEEVSKGINLIDVSKTDAEDHDHDHDAEDHADHDHEHDAEDHDHDTEDHEHEGSDHHSEDGHNHHYTLDPHTWVSPKSAIMIAENIKNSLITADEANKQYYEKNYTELKSKLEAIDGQYEEALSKTALRTIVVSHQAFGYIARDYGLQQISIMGLSPNAEPRAQDILNISKLVKEHNVKYIFFEELVSDNLAKMLASEAKVDTMVIYSLEGLTTQQEKNGENYMTLMERNLQNLIQALQ